MLSWGPEADSFDLVSAQYMHLPSPALEALHRRLAAAVRPGGTLLMVGHHPDDLHANVGRTGRPEMFWSAEELADDWIPPPGRSCSPLRRTARPPTWTGSR